MIEILTLPARHIQTTPFSSFEHALNEIR